MGMQIEIDHEMVSQSTGSSTLFIIIGSIWLGYCIAEFIRHNRSGK